MTSFVLKGDIIDSKNLQTLETRKDAYLVCEEDQSRGVFQKLPDQYKGLPLYDYQGHLILPGLVDLHLHAPQFPFAGLGMDLELLDWLNQYAFPQESRYIDLTYARKAFGEFIEAIKKGPNTRFVIFSSLHTDASLLLMDMMEESGLISYVGKVNMDRNGGKNLEETTEESIFETKRWLKSLEGKYKRTKPIITPRFVPSCSSTLMRALGDLAKENNLAIQSHLSENKNEIAWVKELHPKSDFYAQVYDDHGLIQENKTIMAHCCWSTKEERKLLKEKGVYIAHCPNSNFNIASGIAPIRSYLKEGQKLALASDVAGGSHLSIFRAMTDAILVSKLYYRLINQEDLPLTVEEAFYLGTRGGGSFFGKVGSFDEGYDLDCIIIKDEHLSKGTKTLKERLEKVMYFSKDEDIVGKYVAGNKIF